VPFLSVSLGVRPDAPDEGQVKISGGRSRAVRYLPRHSSRCPIPKPKDPAKHHGFGYGCVLQAIVSKSDSWF
jgi:hypothetical protein